MAANLITQTNIIINTRRMGCAIYIQFCDSHFDGGRYCCRLLQLFDVVAWQLDIDMGMGICHSGLISGGPHIDLMRDSFRLQISLPLSQ